jgi:hypothetical protein
VTDPVICPVVPWPRSTILAAATANVMISFLIAVSNDVLASIPEIRDRNPPLIDSL